MSGFDADAYLGRGMRKGPMRDLARAALAAGWTGRITGHNSLLLRSPDGESTVVLPLTTSDHRSHKNARSAFRRAGMEV